MARYDRKSRNRFSIATLAAAAALLFAGGCADIRQAIDDALGGWTKGYTRTYSREIGQMMGPRYDSLALDGRGIRIGVLDAGFGSLRSDPRTRELRVVDYRDFTTGDTTGFFRDPMEHGRQVCMNIGGRMGSDTLLGLAPRSEFYLAKIDLQDREPRSEEERMMRGIEWLLDKKVDLITCSISYTSFDDFDGYTPEQLDGRSSRISRFLDSILRAHPRLLFIQSAGNEGDKPWRYIGFPGDVREAVTVGAVDWEGQTRREYSSTGRPEADYIKPDVVVSDSPRGTSFSTPVIAGLCAAMLQYNRVDRATLIAALHASGSRAATPDREVGYGVPQLDRLVALLTPADAADPAGSQPDHKNLKTNDPK